MSGDAAGAGRNRAGDDRLRALLGLGDAGADRASTSRTSSGSPIPRPSVMISIPVVLGSLLRLPLRCSPTGLGPACAWGDASPAGAGGPGRLHVRLRGAARRRLPARRWRARPSRSAFRSSPSGSCRAPGLRARRLRDGQHRHRDRGLSVPAIRNSAGQEVAGLVFGAVIAVYGLIWWSIARDVPNREPKHQPYMEVLRSGWSLYRLSPSTSSPSAASSRWRSSPKPLTDWFDYSLTDAGLRAAGLRSWRWRARGRPALDRVGGSTVLAFCFVGVGVDAIGPPGRRRTRRSSW